MRRAALINSIWRLAWAIGLSGIQKIKGSGTARIAYPTEATVGVRAGLPSHGGQACATPTGVSVVMRIAAELVLMLKQYAVPYYHRTLPHWLPEGHAIFLTWRLHGSLLASIRRVFRVEKTWKQGRNLRESTSNSIVPK